MAQSLPVTFLDECTADLIVGLSPFVTKHTNPYTMLAVLKRLWVMGKKHKCLHEASLTPELKGQACWRLRPETTYVSHPVLEIEYYIKLLKSLLLFNDISRPAV